MITKMSRPLTGPVLRVGARGKLDSQGDRTHGHMMTADRSDPRGLESRKIFPTSRILRLHAPRRPIVTKGNRRPTMTRRGLKKEG